MILKIDIIFIIGWIDILKTIISSSYTELMLIGTYYYISEPPPDLGKKFAKTKIFDFS